MSQRAVGGAGKVTRMLFHHHNEWIRPRRAIVVPLRKF